MKPIFFKTQQDLRKWFIKNHLSAEELIIGYYKKGSGIASVDWPQSVDEALCFGWIDGIRRSIDVKSYQIRFTPRRPNSHWSNINIKKIEQLFEKDLMHPAGIEVWEKRNIKRTSKPVSELKHIKLDAAFEKQLKENKKAWGFFKKQLAPAARRISIFWVMTAKQQITRERRMAVLIASSEKNEKIPPLRWSKK